MDGRGNSRVGLLDREDRRVGLRLCVVRESMTGIVVRMVGPSLLFLDLLGLVVEICGREVLGLIKPKQFVVGRRR